MNHIEFKYDYCLKIIFKRKLVFSKKNISLEVGFIPVYDCLLESLPHGRLFLFLLVLVF
jgi:hypothetical protein